MEECPFSGYVDCLITIVHIQHRGEEAQSVSSLRREWAFLTFKEDAGQRLSAASLVGGLTPSCSLVSSSRLRPVSSAAASLPPFSLLHTHQLLHWTNTPGRAGHGCSWFFSVPHGPNPASIRTVEQNWGDGPDRRAASEQGCREEVPARVGGQPGSESSEQGLPHSGPKAPNYGGTREVSGQRGPGSYRVLSASRGGYRQGAFGMHFALGHPRPLPPALWGHWDGTKPSAANQRPHRSLSSEP